MSLTLGTTPVRYLGAHDLNRYTTQTFLSDSRDAGFWSKADRCGARGHVRFAPESDQRRVGTASAQCRVVAESALMRALQYDAYGPVEHLSLRDAPSPRPAAGPLVRVTVAALNPKDALFRKGKFKVLSGRRFPKALRCRFRRGGRGALRRTAHRRRGVRRALRIAIWARHACRARGAARRGGGAPPKGRRRGRRGGRGACRAYRATGTARYSTRRARHFCAH